MPLPTYLRKDSIAHTSQQLAGVTLSPAHPVVALLVVWLNRHALRGDLLRLEHRCQLQLAAASNGITDLLFGTLVGWLVEDPALEAVGQVLLGDPVVAIGVWIEVIGAVSQAFTVAAGIL